MTYYYCVVTGTCGSITSNISGAITINTPTPSVVLSSGVNPNTVQVNSQITPTVYTYSNAANDNDVTALWFASDYTTSAISPDGVSLSINSTSKTITLSGTPTSIGSSYYIVSVAGGNSIQGSLVVTDTPTKINEANTTSVSVQGSMIKNPNQERITVFNSVGGVVATANSDIQLSNLTKGAYIVKTASGKNIKFVITK